MNNLNFNRTRKIKEEHRIFQKHTEQLPLIFYAVEQKYSYLSDF